MKISAADISLEEESINCDTTEDGFEIVQHVKVDDHIDRRKFFKKSHSAPVFPSQPKQRKRVCYSSSSEDKPKSATEEKEKMADKSKESSTVGRTFYWIVISILLCLLAVLIINPDHRTLPKDVEGVLNNITRQAKIQMRGQDAQIDLIVDKMKTFFSYVDLHPPLVFSIHGGSGTGKSFLAYIISRHLSFAKVHDILLPDARVLPASWHEPCYTTSCSRQVNVFIYDDFEYATPEVLDEIAQNLVTWSRQRDPEKRKPTIVFLLSSVGDEAIRDYYYDKVLESTLSSWQEAHDLGAVRKHLEKEGHTKWASGLGEKGVWMEVVPFLPLTKPEVEFCIREACSKLNVRPTTALIEQVFGTISWFPSNEYPLISISGCKRIYNRVSLSH